MTPKLSVIIPVYNEEKDIGECLTSLTKQSYKNFEVIIVDDGSTDNTLGIVKEFSKVKIIKGKHKGPGFSRNLGAKAAKGEFLVFVDADMTFDKDYLKNMVTPMQKDKNLIGTTHDYEIARNTKNIWSRCWGVVRIMREKAKDIKIFRAIRRDEFLKMGGFDPRYGYADDQTFWFKHKVKPLVAKDTICYHNNPETLKAVYKQSRWIGASIDNPLIKKSLIKYLSPLLLFLVSPIAIPILAIRRCQKNKDFAIFPQMLIFMVARYVGTIAGISRNVYFRKNVR